MEHDDTRELASGCVQGDFAEADDVGAAAAAGGGGGEVQVRTGALSCSTRCT